MKENSNYNIHTKFQVHATNIFELEAKNMRAGNHPPLYLTLTGILPRPQSRMVNFPLQ